MFPAASAAILWGPGVQGRMLRVIDPARTIPEYIPYPELTPVRPAPKNVPLRISLYLFPVFPAARLTAVQGMMTREQLGGRAGFAVPRSEAGE